MIAAGSPFYAGGPGLWYDRRRDDHVFTARPDGNVWSPFYEMPWARSGQGTAWDGLSKFDLSRFNPWYFARLEAFARLCDERGLIFYNYMKTQFNAAHRLEIAPGCGHSAVCVFAGPAGVRAVFGK